MYMGIRSADHFADHIRAGVRELIVAVAVCMLHIRLLQRRHHLRVRAETVVTSKIDHRKPPANLYLPTS